MRNKTVKFFGTHNKERRHDELMFTGHIEDIRNRGKQRRAECLEWEEGLKSVDA